MIGGNDLFIAAHARSLGLRLVTNDIAEFNRVKGLTLENWTTLPVRRGRAADTEQMFMATRTMRSRPTGAPADDVRSLGAIDDATPFTPKPGQYFAFIYCTKIHGVAPTEADGGSFA